MAHYISSKPEIYTTSRDVTARDRRAHIKAMSSALRNGRRVEHAGCIKLGEMANIFLPATDRVWLWDSVAELLLTSSTR